MMGDRFLRGKYGDTRCPILAVDSRATELNHEQATLKNRVLTAVGKVVYIRSDVSASMLCKVPLERRYRLVIEHPTLLQDRLHD